MPLAEAPSETKQHLLLVARVHLLAQLVADLIFEVVEVGLQGVAGGDLAGRLLVLLCIFLRLRHKPVNLVLAQAVLVVGDRDLLPLACKGDSIVREV